MKRDTNKFAWGVLVRMIEAGPTEFKNVLVDHKGITSKDIKRQACKMWGKNYLATFQYVVPEDMDLQLITPGLQPAQNTFKIG